MTSGLVPTIKEISMEAVNASKPCNIMFGTIVSTSPLKIKIHDMTLTTKFLVVGHSVQQALSNGSIVAGNKVIVIRQTGGQLYFVIDW